MKTLTGIKIVASWMDRTWSGEYSTFYELENGSVFSEGQMKRKGLL